MSADTPRLVGVGMGPGDPDLVTVGGVRTLRAADVVLVPVMAGEDGPGRAETTVLAHLDGSTVRRAPFALDDRGGVTSRREAAWDDAARTVAQAFAGGARLVAFATIGDPNVYSTFSYLAQGVRELVPDVEVTTVPGITAMQDLAARSGTVLCEGTESLALMPLTAGTGALERALEAFDTVVGYKGGRRMPEVLDLLRRTDRLDGAVHGSSLGLAGEHVGPAAELTGPAPYLSTLIVPARRGGRGRRL